jgi:hypothetical protein
MGDVRFSAIYVGGILILVPPQPSITTRRRGNQSTRPRGLGEAHPSGSRGRFVAGQLRRASVALTTSGADVGILQAHRALHHEQPLA